MAASGFIAVRQQLLHGDVQAFIDAFGAGGSIDILDDTDALIRTLTFSGVRLAATAEGVSPVTLLDLTDPKTGSGTPALAVFKNAAGLEQFRAVASVGLADGSWLIFLSEIEADVPVVSRDAALQLAVTVELRPPVLLTGPVVSVGSPGTLIVGAVLSVSTGTWSNADSFTYQWLLDSEEIAGATEQSFTVTAAEVGTSVIGCRVTAINDFGQTTVGSNTVGPFVASTLTVATATFPATIRITQGETFNLAPFVSGGVPPYTFGVTPALRTGVTLNTATGLLTASDTATADAVSETSWTQYSFYVDDATPPEDDEEEPPPPEEEEPPPPEPPPPSGMPLWLRNAPIMTWSRIANTAFQDIQEADVMGRGKTNIVAEAGIAMDHTTSTMWFLGGGHGDGANNTVYSIDLRQNAPAWRVRRSATPAVHIWPVSDRGLPHYADGRPASRHCYCDAVFSPQRNQLLFTGAAAVWGNGNGHFPNMDAFNPATGDWLAANTYPSMPTSNTSLVGVGRPNCINFETGDIYRYDLHGRMFRWKHSQGTYGTWSLLGTYSGAIGTETTMDYNWDRNEIVRWSLTPQVFRLAADGTIASNQHITKTGPYASVVQRINTSFWCSWINKYIYIPGHGEWDDTPTMFTVDPDTWFVDKMAGITGTMPFIARGGGYNRVVALRDLPVIVMFGRTQEDMAFLRLR